MSPGAIGGVLMNRHLHSEQDIKIVADRAWAVCHYFYRCLSAEKCKAGTAGLFIQQPDGHRECLFRHCILSSGSTGTMAHRAVQTEGSGEDIILVVEIAVAHFAGCIQSGNDAAVLTGDPSLFGGGYTAGRTEGRGIHLDRIERCLGKGGKEGGRFVERGVRAGCGRFIIGIKGV